MKAIAAIGFALGGLFALLAVGSLVTGGELVGTILFGAFAVIAFSVRSLAKRRTN